MNIVEAMFIGETATEHYLWLELTGSRGLSSCGWETTVEFHKSDVLSKGSVFGWIITTKSRGCGLGRGVMSIITVHHHVRRKMMWFTRQRQCCIKKHPTFCKYDICSCLSAVLRTLLGGGRPVVEDSTKYRRYI